MTLDQIFDEIKKDLGKLDLSRLAEYSAENTYLFNKYHKTYRIARKKLRQLQKQEIILLSELDQYYEGTADEEVVKRKGILDKRFKFKDGRDKAIKSDNEYIDLSDKIHDQEEIVETLKETMQAIRDRQWNIRNANESLKFTQGNV